MAAVRLTDEVLEELERICERRKFSPGEEITVKGERHKDMFFILSGWVEIRFLDDRSESCSLRVGERSALGEMGFLSGENAIATAVAVGEVTTLELDETTIDKLEAINPDAAAEFSSYLVNTIDKRLQ